VISIYLVENRVRLSFIIHLEASLVGSKVESGLLALKIVVTDHLRGGTLSALVKSGTGEFIGG
jgi:hypothetical protein